MPLWFLLTLALGQAPRPSAPANMAVRDATATATVSSGEDAYITWTVDPSTTGMAYDISLDGGPWVAIAPAFAIFLLALIANFAGDALRDLIGA